MWRFVVDCETLLRAASGEIDPAALRAACAESGALDRCQDLLARYKEEAIRSLADLENASLKGLLRRVLGKIFNDTEIKGWCKEQEQRNAALRLGEVGSVTVPVAAA